MKLSQARSIYAECKKEGPSAFTIRRHCWADHPERKFTQAEVLRLLLGTGHLTLNQFPSAKPDSFIWTCKDDDNDRVEIVVIIKDNCIKATAISAYRESKEET